VLILAFLQAAIIVGGAVVIVLQQIAEQLD